MGGPGSTLREMRPAPCNSLNRSARTESLMPTTLRLSSANPEDPLVRVPKMTPFQRLPRNLKAWARAPSHDLEASSQDPVDGGAVTSSA